MNGTIKPIPLKESEAREIQLLWGVMEILSETSPRLKKRLQACGRWRQLRACAAWMGRIVGDVMDTIEPPKRRKFMLNLENQEMRTVCKGVPGHHAGLHRRGAGCAAYLHPAGNRSSLRAVRRRRMRHGPVRAAKGFEKDGYV